MLAARTTRRLRRGDPADAGVRDSRHEPTDRTRGHRVRRHRDRRRHGRGGGGARPGPARRVGGAGREAGLRVRHVLQVVQADPRRAALPRAGRHRPRAGVASREDAPRAARPAPGAARCPSWCRCTGAGTAASSPCASACGSTTCSRRARATERFRVLRRPDTLSLEPALRPDGLRGAGYYFDDLLLFPERMCLENVLSAVRHGARAVNYCEVEEIVRGAEGFEGVRVRDLLTDRLHSRARPDHRQRRRAVGGPDPRAGRPPRRRPPPRPHHQGHPLPAAADHRARRLPVRRRRAHDLRHPVARVLAGRHHRHGLRRGSRPAVGDPSRGRLPPDRGAPGPGRPASGPRPRGLHLCRRAPALVRGGHLRLPGLPRAQGRPRGAGRLLPVGDRAPSSPAFAAWPRRWATG